MVGLKVTPILVNLPIDGFLNFSKNFASSISSLMESCFLPAILLRLVAASGDDSFLFDL